MAKSKPAYEAAAPATDKKKALETAMAQIKKSFGDGSIMRLGDAASMNVEVIPTGSLTLDLALGVGGLPKGRIVEIYGPESSGKTTLASMWWQKPRRWAVRWPLWTPNTHWTLNMRRHWGRH